MPLRDHFHPPLYKRPPWSSITTMWAAELVRWLNRTLPTGEFVAYPTLHLGTQVEADVAEYNLGAVGANGHRDGNGVARSASRRRYDFGHFSRRHGGPRGHLTRRMGPVRRH
ncbi:hypothetical protein FTUN_8538 [Frigoriglobus tundricola]|uniref:Uncharacterized protein n=1 Tax=Frigoriglobus tundricola TaxID=2774151 RepID=A0A6M5Z3A0_9BACT|nr:hypothetical protein FTUN_8538 [Frigoriglobus tundricola]